MRIFILIASARVYTERREGCRSTWIKRLDAGMDYIFHAAGGDPLEPDVQLRPDAEDVYGKCANLWHGMRWAVKERQFDWFFRVDDDTYVVPERIRALIGSFSKVECAMDNRSFIGVECPLDGSKVNVNFNRAEYIGSSKCAATRYGTGGAGFFMSRRLVEHVASLPEPVDNGRDMDDGWVGWVARRFGCPFHWTHRLVHDKGPWPALNNDLVTGHYLTPEDMRACYRELYEKSGS